MFTVLGKFSKLPAEIANILPSSLYSAKLRENQVKYVKYVVCRKCHKLYYYENCMEGPGNAKRSKCCSFVRFPNHSQRRMRSPCNTLLLKTVELTGGRTKLYPFLTYCYLGLDISLQMLLNKQTFIIAVNYRERGAQKLIYLEMYMMAKFGRIFNALIINPFFRSQETLL